jgi:hypothetical protein
MDDREPKPNSKLEFMKETTFAYSSATFIC